MSKHPTRGRPKLAPADKKQKVTVHLLPVSRRQCEIAAIRGGFINSHGKPDLGAWMESVARE
jgi:hypothetical protein